MAAPMLRINFPKVCRLYSNIQCSVNRIQTQNVFPRCTIYTASCKCQVPGKIASEASDKGKKISHAMRAYLERAQKHDAFMSEQIADYEIGKRHLANIMGADADNFSQEDIDQAIEYLLPSGLFDKKARPMLKHPEDIFPKKKAAQFSMDGRPFHPFFYTGKPNYYMIMHEASMKFDEIKNYEDQMWNRGLFSSDDQTAKVMAASSEWITLDELRARTLEKVDEHDYKRFVILLERIMHHPYGVREKEFLNQFRKPLVIVGMTDDVQPLKEAENGRKFAEGEGRRKWAVAAVKVWSDGSGKVTVNGHGFVDYFPQLMDREQIAFPMQFTNHLTDLDIEATVHGGGPSGQAGAIRLGVSRALMSFVEKDMIERMRLAGLLTKDPRRRERKKPGQPGARKKPTWKKR